MTLAIARRMKSQLFLLADTRLTDPRAQTAKTAAQGDIVKVARIAPGVALAFAGSPELATNAIDEFIAAQFTDAIYKKTVEHFRSATINTQNAYILAFAQSNKIVRVQDGESISMASETWIGDKEAAEILRHKFKVSPLDEIECRLHGHGVIDATKIDNYVKQFESALISRRADTIGGFPIGMISVGGDFKYLRYKTMWSPLNNTIVSEDGAEVINWGNERGGIRTILEPTDTSKSAVAINFPNADLCFVFHSFQGLPRSLSVFRGNRGRYLREKINSRLGIDFEIDGTEPPDGSSKLRVRTVPPADEQLQSPSRTVRTVRIATGAAPFIFSDQTTAVDLDGYVKD